MGQLVKNGDICWYTFPAPNKRRPVLILTRDSAIRVLNSITVAPITSTIRNIPTELILNADDGLPEICAMNFDNIQTVPKTNISPTIAHLSNARMQDATTAIKFALALSD